jgi:GT2 family glycosyltransferase
MASLVRTGGEYRFAAKRWRERCRGLSKGSGMLLSVVMVTYNSAACVGPALRAVREHLKGAEIVVVDNGSSDATLEAISAEAPTATVVSGHGNVGFGAACNRGVGVASHAHVLLLNPDVLISAAAGLDPLLAGEGSFGLVAPALAADGFETPRPQLFRERHWLAETLDHVVGPLWPRGWARRRPYADSTAAEWASGAALLLRRDEFAAVGGFDERLFLYYEDRDLSKRYLRAGLPIRATDGIAGKHAGGESSAADSLDALRLAFAVLGWLEYLAKWDGEARARRAAVVTLAALRIVQVLLGVATNARASSRLERKRRQLAALRGLLTGGDLPLPPGPYACARHLLAS